MTIDFHALGALAAAEGKDMTKATTGGGGDYTPPKAGFCLLRFVGYVEVGKQKGSYQGKPTAKDMAQLVFELSGPNHPPTVLDDGSKVPLRVILDVPVSLNAKAGFFKLFNRMNYKGACTHMIQLLGEAYKGQIIHRKYTGRDGKERVAVELYDKASGNWTIEPPRRDVLDMDENSPNFQLPTGEQAIINVPPALTESRGFLWDYSPIEHFNALFIEGEYPERKDEKTGEVTAPAKSKNVLQNKIKQALNFKGSRIYTLIAEAGGSLDLPTGADLDEADGADTGDAGESTPPPPNKSEPVPEGKAADDALAGVI